MKLRCYIVDDESHAIVHLKNLIAQIPELELVGSALNPLQALAEIKILLPDITFTDVDMPVLNGIELAGMISPYTHIVFTTAFRDFGPEAYEKNAADYLLKPITYPRLWQSLEKVRQMKRQTELPDYFFVKTGLKGVLQRIEVNELRYISGLAAYVELHLEHEKLISYLSLQEVLEHLPPARFFRIHKSYIVNQDFIQAIEGGQVKLSKGLFLPIGRSYREAFQRFIERHSLISRRL